MKTVEYDGKTFLSLKEAAEHYGIPHPTFRYRVRKFGVKKAIEMGVNHTGAGRPAGTKKVLPPDIIELAEENGVSYALLYQRYQGGMHMFDAAIEPPGMKPGKKSEFSGEQIEELARIGLTPRMVRQRMKTGWTRYEAMNIPKGEKRK